MPRQGKNDASATTQINTNKNLSIRKRCNQDIETAFPSLIMTTENACSSPRPLAWSAVLHRQRFTLFGAFDALLDDFHHPNGVFGRHGIPRRAVNGRVNTLIIGEIISASVGCAAARCPPSSTSVSTPSCLSAPQPGPLARFQTVFLTVQAVLDVATAGAVHLKARCRRRSQHGTVQYHPALRVNQHRVKIVGGSRAGT